MPRESFSIAGVSVSAGTTATVGIPLPKLNSHTDLDLPVHVIHGRKPGPTLFVSAAVHGDELNPNISPVEQRLCCKYLKCSGFSRDP